MRNLLLHEIHGLFEAVQWQFTIILHLSQQIGLHDRFGKHVELIVLEVLLHDLSCCLLVSASLFIMLFLGTEIIVLNQLILLEDYGLRELFIQDVEFIRSTLIFLIFSLV